MFGKDKQPQAEHQDQDRGHIVLSVADALELFRSGIIGTIEFRSWLALRSPEFRQVRDVELDEHIHRLAETQKAWLTSEEENPSGDN